VPALLDEFSRTAGTPILAAKLRMWLERAMQISPRSFASAQDAQAAFDDLPDEADVHAATVATGLDAFPQEATTPAAPAAPASPPPAPEPAAVSDDRRGPVGDRRAPSRRVKLGTLLIAGLALLSAAEGVALFVIPNLRPAAELIEVRPAVIPAAVPDVPTLPAADAAANTLAGEPPAAPAATAATAQAPATTPAPSPTPATSEAALATAASAAGANPAAKAPPAATTRFGGMTVKSAMELQVFENGTLIGSTAGPIAINEGPRVVEFVNETLGFRYRETVNVKAGQMTNVSIAVPNGRVSINAAPWAEVDIDGTPAGETPLANISLPIGTHEITFRHPQLGTKKQTIVVRVDGLTKVTQVFQQEPRR
jgi:hypothetical protein